LIVVFVAVGVRFAAAILDPVMPALLVIGLLAGLYLFIIRGRR
jgi:hypothetical protein